MTECPLIFAAAIFNMATKLLRRRVWGPDHINQYAFKRMLPFLDTNSYRKHELNWASDVRQPEAKARSQIATPQWWDGVVSAVNRLTCSLAHLTIWLDNVCCPLTSGPVRPAHHSRAPTSTRPRFITLVSTAAGMTRVDRPERYSPG
jgi:hypothetical protein